MDRLKMNGCNKTTENVAIVDAVRIRLQQSTLEGERGRKLVAIVDAVRIRLQLG